MYPRDALLQALQWLDSFLKCAVAVVENPTDYDIEMPRSYQGVYISKEEVEQLLSRSPGTPTLYPQVKLEDIGFSSDNHTSQFVWLREAFNLSTFDIGLIIIAVAPEVDLRYERIFAYLQDDITRKRPSVDLALNLLCSSAEAKLMRHSHFVADAPLLRHKLLQLIPDPNQIQPPLLSHYLKLDDQIIRLLLDRGGLDARLMLFCELVQPVADLEEVPLNTEMQRGLRTLVIQTQENQQPLQLYFRGANGIGRRRTAEALAKELGAQLLSVNLKRALVKEAEWEHILKLIFREAWFQNAILYLDGLDVLRRDERAIQYQYLLEQLIEDAGITILSGEQPWVAPPMFFGKELTDLTVVSFPMPDFAQRRLCWLAGLAAAGVDLDDNDLNDLTSRFQLTPGQIAEAVITARNYARWRVTAQSSDAGLFPESEQPTLQELFTAARSQSNQKLSQVTQKIQPRYSWEDIVLPPELLAQLQEIINSVKHRHIVYDQWGFGSKLSSGKGLNALFAGSSGTGKTMAAEVMAHELSLDLYKIDLSQIVSKYIGETEKNLDRVFREAQTSNAILFFDEADALFGKRSEVKDAHDRYANIEIGYLLQKMEEYEGVAILATNLRGNLDEAFARRLHFIIEFPFPDEAYRALIWQGIFPAQSPLAEDVNFNVLARSFRLSGGNIKNVALAAAFLAAEEKQSIGMKHLRRAAKRELQKVGRAWETPESR